MNRLGLHWQLLERNELASRLNGGGLQNTRDLGGSTLYEFTYEQQAQLAVVLPDGQCLLITPASPLTPSGERRRHGS